ncbi:hypothetical protein EDC04DRAFT_2586643 [Pisolithus marmoratus]|nr:hypothetical protein EDC04DRAFT_2586643 [Pisolithus marmoratus]
MAVKYFKVLHAHEEILQLNVEVHQLQAWVDSETLEIGCVAEELLMQDPLLSAELWALHHQQHHVNTEHHLHLQYICNLDGYSGAW